MASQSDKRKVEYSSARETAEKHQSGDRPALLLPDGAELFTLKKSCRIDILPYKVGGGNPMCADGLYHYERTYYTHRKIGPNEDAVVCLNKTFKKPCPVCEYRKKLNDDPDADQDTIKELAPKVRQLFNIIDLADEDRKVRIWEFSYHLFGKLLDKLIKDADEEDAAGFDTFHRLDKGSSLKLTVSEEVYKGNKYYEVSGVQLKPRAEQYDTDILDSVYCLDEVVREMPYDQLKKLLLQTGDDDTPAPKTKPKPAVKDDDDDEPAPKPKAKVKTAADLGIEVGSVVETEEHGTCEVVHVNTDGDLLRVKDGDGEIHKGISVGDVDLVKAKPKPKPAVKDDDDDEPAPKKKLITAESAGIVLGGYVMHAEHGKCEVIHISGDGTSLKLEDSDGEIHKAIGVKEVTLAKAKAKPKVEEDDDEPAPKPKAKPKPEEDEEPKPKAKAKAKDEDWDED